MIATPRLRILSVFGTRPEAIKMAPLALKLKSHPGIDAGVCLTGQHRDMLDPVLALFALTANYDLKLMRPDQSLPNLTATMLHALGPVYEDFRPDCVLVQGDTTTAFTAALAAFYHHIPIAHIEAGLRTASIASPWPEEANRRLVSTLSQLHFAPTQEAASNLMRMGVEAGSITVTGNTVIDALQLIRERLSDSPPLRAQMAQQFPYLREGAKQVLITTHRRENFGDGIGNICDALRRLTTQFPEVDFIYPLHRNPHIHAPVTQYLQQIVNLHLTPPLDYLAFIFLMETSSLILTDSGGIQEEAPALGIPVLLLRDSTERPEAVAAGTVRLVGSDTDTIVASVSELLTDDATYRRMSRAHNPYGDGHACDRIIAALLQNFLHQPA